jgi:hypothetical protein
MGLPRSSALREEANREHVNASQRDELPAWEKWSAADQQKVLRHCGELMRMYGYLPADEAAMTAATVEAS